MRWNIACVSTLTSLILVLCGSSSAQTVNINATDRGWYTPTGFHNPNNVNYAVGDGRGPGCVRCENDSRNFFAFSVPGFTPPIASAKLALYVPPASLPGFYSHDSSEIYELHDVVTSIAALVAGTGGVAAWNDLGTGVVYGSRTMTAADMGGVVEIELNSAAIAALNTPMVLFGIGGSITTLDSLANDEYVFGRTDFGPEITQLRLTLVPEPSTLLLLAIGAISLLGYRKAKS